VGGERAPVSNGPGESVCRLGDKRLDRLVRALEQGPAEHGFGEDQWWTPARVADLIARMFHVRYRPPMPDRIHQFSHMSGNPAAEVVQRDARPTK
jgi:putative transposase